MGKPIDKLKVLESRILMNSRKIFTEVKDTKEILSAYCEGNSEAWWNLALLKTPINLKKLKRIESFKLGNKLHFLATEKGHYPYDFYEGIGFKPAFTAYLYTWNNN